MRNLKSPIGYLVGPTDSVEIPTKKGVGVLPFSFFS
jgi:hypothetical protein